MIHPIIEIEHLWKTYLSEDKKEATIVLKDFSLTIDEGEFVCIIGPSGCGKTTLLNVIAGFERIQRGSVRYRGKEIEEPSSERSVVFQEFSLLPWMNVQKNVAFSIDRKKNTDAQRMEKALKYLKAVGMEEYADYRPNDLSGGMKQRVAIARSLAMEPDMMLMDEPFSSLDEQTRKHLDTEVKRIWEKDGKTVIFVTHDIVEAIELATKIVLLSNDGGFIKGIWTLSDDKKQDSGYVEKLKLEIMDRFQLCNCVARPNLIEILEEKK